LIGDSTKGDPSGEFGVKTPRRMLVNGISGRYLLMSGQAFLYSYPEDADVIQEFPPFPEISWWGTYLAMRIPVQENWPI